VILVALALAFFQPGEGEDEAWQALRIRIESAPQEVATFIERRAGCNHFLGEDAYDRERATEIRNALRELRCDRIARDERALRQTYGAQPVILRLLTDTETLNGW
jgi:hypothetical protein